VNAEFHLLSPEQRAAVLRLIRVARARPGQHSEDLSDGSQAYAYCGGRGVHWGVNRASDRFFNDKRGVWPKDQPA
jgi:hypothetical protein